MQLQSLTPEQIEAKENVINQLESGDFYLSYSGLKAFALSPASFIEYKIGEKPQTKAMKIGSALHCAILEPEEFEKRYVILTKDMLPNPDKDFRDSANKLFKVKFLQQAESEDKEILDPLEHEECLLYQRLVYSNLIAKYYIENLTKKEQYAEWYFQGIKFRGYIDGIGNGYIMDLKKVADASPDKIKRSAIYDLWLWQGALYKQSQFCDEFTGFYNLAIDKTSPAVYELGEFNYMKALGEITKMLDSFKRCIDLQLWDSGYEFWAENSKGIFTI